MSRIKSLLSISVLAAASVIGCRAVAQHSGEGRLDLVIRPASAVASSRPVEGHFVVRNLEQGGSQRIEVGSTYETLSVPLREGAYSIEWRTELPLRLSDDPAVWARELSSAGAPQPLSIHAGRVTTVQVTATVGGARAGEPVAQAEELPSVQILVARR